MQTMLMIPAMMLLLLLAVGCYTQATGRERRFFTICASLFFGAFLGVFVATIARNCR